MFVVAAAVAYAFYIQLSALKGQPQHKAKETSDDGRALAQKAAKELESAREELVRKRAEAADLREKLNDLRTRQHKQREAEKRTKGTAEADLKELLTVARRDLEDERARFDVLSRESKGMGDEIARLRESQKNLDDALKAAQAAAARAASAPAASTSAPAPAPVVVVAPQKTDDELKARVELLDRQLREARRKVIEQEEEAKKARGKASTVNRLQLLTKNELDLFKEKLVWSEKRVVELEKLLFDNKIALPEREVAPQPKAPAIAPGVLARESANTGGEGVVAGEAEYVPETATATEAPAAEAAPTTTEAPAAEAASEAADASTGPSAVPPIRRPKASSEGQPELAAKAE
jgi:hypothetical protein